MRKTFAIISVLMISNLSIGQTFEDSVNVKEMDAVIITGQYRPQSVKNSVYQVRLLTSERIRLSGATQVQQVLTNQLGIHFSTDNTLGTSDVQMMGMSGRNVKILLDGIPMTDRGDTRESLSQVDINTVDRIEIVEGPMSVSYGSDALAGVINIITKKVPKNSFSIIAKIQEETAGSEYHPFNYKGVHMQNLGVSWGRKQWIFSAGGSHNDAAGFGGDQFGRNKKWKPKEQWLGHAKIGYSNRDLSVYYRLDALDEIITNRGAINFDTYKAIDKEYNTDRFMHQLQSSWHINNKFQINSLASFTDYKRKTTTVRHDFEKNTEELTTGEGEQDLSKFNSLVFRSTLQAILSKKFSLQPGIEINRDAASGARIKGSPVIGDYALFISSEIKASEKISVRPGLRFIKNTVYDAPPVIPSINTKFKLSKSADLRLAYAYGFRAPALRELYFDFHDTNHDIVGNPNLEAEYSNSFSGSFNYDLIRKKEITLSTTLGAFYNEFRNLINYALNPAVANQYIYINVDKFKTTGLNLENKLDWKNLNASIGFSWIGRYNSLNDEFKQEELPVFTWTPEFNSSVIYTIKKIDTKLALFYKFTGIRPGYQVVVYNNGEEIPVLTKISSFNWADLAITKTVFKYLTISTGVKNLFNITDIANSSTVQGVHSSGAAVPMGYGRSYFISLAFQRNSK